MDDDDVGPDDGGANLEILFAELSPEAREALKDHFESSGGNVGEGSGDDEAEEKCNDIRYDNYTRTLASDGSVISIHKGPEVLRVALINAHHSLWGELLTNAAKTLAGAIDSQTIVCEGKNCLELGAGAALPSIVAALNGAAAVVITDYGMAFDRSLMEPIDINIQGISPYVSSDECLMKSDCYIFGYDVAPLLGALPGEGEMFDVVFLADLIFNRSEHFKLLTTVNRALRSGGVAWVTFSHHDPEKSDADMVFFSLAQQEFNFSVDFIKEENWPPLFVENDGLDEERGRVFFYKLVKP